MIAAEGPHDDELRALRAENERLKSELANLNTICDSLPVMISHVGADLRFIHINKTYARFFPHPAEWAIGRHLSEVAGEPHLSLARPFAERALRGERVSFESRIRHRDGTMHDISVTYTPRRAPDGSVSGFIALVEDITEKKAIEERVRESEERLRLALESAGMVAWEWNVESDAVLRFGWNPDVLGPEPAQCGKDFFASVHPDDRAQLAAAYRGVLENGNDYQLEFRLVVPDGTIRWMNDRGGLKTDSRGRRLLRGVFTDITELRSTMTALRESEERYRFLANSLPLFIWTGGSQGVNFINDYWYQYTGLPREARFDSWPEAVHPEDLKDLIPAIGLARQMNREAVFEYRVRRADGQWRWHAGVEKRQSDPDRWLGFGFEIHDIRMATAALRESEERHRIVAESAIDAILTVRPEGDIVFANPAAARILGCGELAGKNLRDIGPDLWSTIRGGASSEAVIDGPDGSHIILDVSVTRAVQNGLPVWIAVARDVTEKKRIEEKLRQTAKLESLGVLAGGIAHDFNNLLTGVLSGASLLTEVLPASSREHEIAETIARASDRAAQLTRQMLAYSGRGRLVTKPVDLSAQVRDITELIAASIPKNVHLEFELEALLPPVEGDPGQINQIIMNLVLNGAEATGEKGGIVRVITRVAEPDEAVRQSNLAGTELASRPHVLLEVVDDGAGMDAATKSRIFDPFFTTKFAGRGLGLAAVLGIVRGHKGGLAVDSRPGAGTRFQVYFPATAAGNADKEMDAAESFPGAKGTVLVVDDEEIVRSSAATILARYGYTVLTAENGYAAIQALAEHGNEISGVVLDLTMPDLTGAETARRLREICPGIRLLGVSGFSETEIAREFGGATDEVLPKPFTPQALIHAVSKLMGGSQSVRVGKS